MVGLGLVPPFGKLVLLPSGGGEHPIGCLRSAERLVERPEGRGEARAALLEDEGRADLRHLGDRGGLGAGLGRKEAEEEEAEEMLRESIVNSINGADMASSPAPISAAAAAAAGQQQQAPQSGHSS